VKYWEIIADNPNKAGWSLGCASAIDSYGRASGTCTGRRKLCIQLAKVASDHGANTINYQISNHGTLRVQFLQVEDYILQSARRRQPNLK
jgi:hypothetical protein